MVRYVNQSERSEDPLDNVFIQVEVGLKEISDGYKLKNQMQEL